MAQTIDEIKSDLDTAKAAQPALNDLNSVSNTAVYKLWRDVVAATTYLVQTLWDKYKLEVDEIVSQYPPGTLGWYVSQMLLFQIDDLLEFVNNKPTYSVIDEDAQIIKFASATVASDQTVVINVAKYDTDGVTLIPLSGGQLSAAEGYLDQIKFAGTKTLLTSLAADDLIIVGYVYYSSTLELATLKANVIAAIKAYLVTARNNGKSIIYAAQIQDAIQSVEGVVDVVIDNIQARNGADPFAVIGRYYIPLSGHAQEASGSPFDSTLQFTNSNV
jgi:hypothetical protein